ncbi:SapC family protein [Methylobacterium sp. WL103]|uniref:SapC family protein n=1 Tax=Methylobacterium sp. WL103 TaxID=2603891 RepID=UPI0011C82B92|nr:SapC family protein [Methylobacterium sp. WL103]TXN07162.1 SapC family protein [Methylobacterium sp. WL103]
MMSAPLTPPAASTQEGLLELLPDKLADLRWGFSNNPLGSRDTITVPITRSELHRISHEYFIVFERLYNRVRPVVLLPQRRPPAHGTADAGIAEAGSETVVYLPLASRLHPFVTEDETGRELVQLDPLCVGPDQANAFFEAGDKESDALAQVRVKLRASWDGQRALAEAAEHLNQAGLLKPFDEKNAAAMKFDMKVPLLAISLEDVDAEFGTRLADWMAHSVTAVELALVAEFSMRSKSRTHPAAPSTNRGVDAVSLIPSALESGWLVEDEALRF